jgi:uncharacterized phage-associated protein
VAVIDRKIFCSTGDVYERVSFMVDVLYISNNFLERSFAEKKEITPMKLQKLLYFTYKHYLQKTREPLFSERFETWRYGPVLSNVYDYFKSYRAKAIDDYYIDKDGKAKKISDPPGSPLVQAINYVWKHYSDCSGTYLSQLTHLPDSAWSKAKEANSALISDNDIIREEWYK